MKIVPVNMRSLVVKDLFPKEAYNGILCKDVILLGFEDFIALECNKSYVLKKNSSFRITSYLYINDLSIMYSNRRWLRNNTGLVKSSDIRRIIDIDE